MSEINHHGFLRNVGGGGGDDDEGGKDGKRSAKGKSNKDRVIKVSPAGAPGNTMMMPDGKEERAERRRKRKITVAR